MQISRIDCGTIINGPDIRIDMILVDAEYLGGSGGIHIFPLARLESINE